MTGCQTRPSRPSPELVHRSQPLLGTFVTISAWGGDRAAVQSAISEAFDEFRRADALMSLHRADSELSRVNRLAVTNAVSISPELFNVLEQAHRIALETDGAFDVTIRPVADLWGFIWKEHRLPTDAELQSVLPRVGFRKVELSQDNSLEHEETKRTKNEIRREPVSMQRLTETPDDDLVSAVASSRNPFLPSPFPPLTHVPSESLRLEAVRRTIRFREPGVSIDLGGIGKGVAVDMAIAKLRSLGITNAMVKAGGDLRVMGAPPDEPFWTVQLEDPQKQGHRIAIPLRDAALSTSGNYENFFEVAGRRYSHILDPRTGLPVQGIAACTVIAPTCSESDAWATACFVSGPDTSRARFGKRFEMWFTLMPTATAKTNWPIRATPGFPQPLKVATAGGR